MLSKETKKKIDDARDILVGQLPLVKLGEICAFEYGKPLKEENRVNGDYPVYGSNGIVGYHNNFLVEAPFIVIGRKGSAGSIHFCEKNGFPIDTTFFVKLENEDKVLLKYLPQVLQLINLKDLNTQAGVPGLNRNDAYRLQIPLPPLEVQQQIVVQIEIYQKVIDGCNLIIENYKPDFDLNENWPVVKLHSICETITDGDHMPPPKSEVGIPFITITNIKIGYGIDFSDTYFVSEEYYAGLKAHRKPKKDDILYTVTGSFGIPVLIDFDKEFCFQRHIGLIRPTSSVISSYLYFYLQTPNAFDQAIKTATGVAQKTVSLTSLRNFSVPLPPLETQRKIVVDLEEDMAAVAGAKRLKAKMEANIRATIGRVWGV